MNDNHREVFGILVRAAYDAGPDSGNFVAASKITEFLNQADEQNPDSHMEATMLTVAGIAQLLRGLVDGSDMFGLGMGDLTPFARLAESLLLGAALYGESIVPVPDEVPDLEDFKLDLSEMDLASSKNE